MRMRHVVIYGLSGSTLFLHIISYLYTYLGVRITKDGNHKPQIERINRGRAAITKVNSILWDRDVILKIKDSHLSCNS